MNTKEIPTAEELFKTEYSIMDNYYPEMASHVRRKVIELVKLHVEACKQEIAEKTLIDRKPTGEGQSSEEETDISFYGDLGYEDYIPVEYTVNKDSILNAYPLTNIK